MGGCCSNEAIEETELEDSEEMFKEVPNMPPEPEPLSPLDYPIYAPTHISIYHNTENPLDGKDEFPELELSPVSDHYD